MDAYQNIIDELVAHVGAGEPALPDEPTGAPDVPPTGQPAPLSVPAGFPRPPHEGDLRYCYFDLEILHPLEEVGGWAGAISQGGVSVLCIWDSMDENPIFYDEGSLDLAAGHLEDADVVVSFNGKAMDVPLIEAHLRRKLALRNHVDVFALAKQALEKMGKGWKGHGLGPMSLKTTGRSKIGTGSSAPLLVRDQKWPELYNYCLRDVILTRDLLTFARRNGYILDADGEELRLDLPQWMKLGGQNG